MQDGIAEPEQDIAGDVHSPFREGQDEDAADSHQQMSERLVRDLPVLND